VSDGAIHKLAVRPRESGDPEPRNVTALDSRLRGNERRTEWTTAGSGRARIGAVALLILVLLQIYLGALVAGLRAGYAYNTWPLIDGALVPDAARLWFEAPWWKNLFDNALTVQFTHRMMAYVLAVAAAAHAYDVRRDTAQAGRALTLLVTMLVQAALGILTLVHVVPIGLALAHQATAMVVLALATVHAARTGAMGGEAAVAPGVPRTFITTP
jgi:heme a synthase